MCLTLLTRPPQTTWCLILFNLLLLLLGLGIRLWVSTLQLSSIPPLCLPSLLSRCLVKVPRLGLNSLQLAGLELPTLLLQSPERPANTGSKHTHCQLASIHAATGPLLSERVLGQPGLGSETLPQKQ